jgi:hypothetical protein
MECGNCGNPKAYRTVSGNGWEYCDRCGEVSSVAAPDVFWDGKEEHGLADDPATGRPRVFGSKGEKARYLRERNLSEAGDRVNGAPPSAASLESGRDRGMSAEQALRIVSQMGRDVRRQEFNRIMKESGRI